MKNDFLSSTEKKLTNQVIFRLFKAREICIYTFGFAIVPGAKVSDSGYYCEYEKDEARWPHGQWAFLWTEQSGFELWRGTLWCVLVLGQDALTVSLHPGI